ncbi:MAG: hypothetical protein ABFS10_00995 [Bacteroidota bacterium]
MNLRKLLVVVTAFAIAMGFLESAVVVYMRELLYPGGFEFPLSPIPVNLAITELLREVATLVMLVTIGMVAANRMISANGMTTGGESASGRFSTGFAWFIYSFAIWDIFYYVFLKLLLGWPQSLMTWDVLFLIPTTWTGPVLSPVVVSLTMILLAMVILVCAERGTQTRIRRLEWMGLILGSLVLIFGFVFDYSQHMLAHFSLFGMLQVKNPEVLEVATSYIPNRFPWWIFCIGEGIILATIALYRRRVKTEP